ncbi:MAG: ABC transporter permease [Egibacteraceae bacterium]
MTASASSATTYAPTPASPPLTRRNGGPLGLLALQVRTEVLAAFRSIEFVIGVVAVPVLLYAMFGLPGASITLPAGTPYGVMMLVSLSAYGIVSLAIFTFGDELAAERGRGWTRTLRATPLPSWVHLSGKMAMAVIYATLIVVTMSAVAVLAGGLSLDAWNWLAFAAVMLAGVLAFSTLGFAIAYLVRPRAAAAIANLIFLPLSFCSGFFFPLSELPGFLSTLAVWLPTYHFGQLAWRQMAPASDVAAFTGIPTASAVVHLAWVLGSAVVFGASALLAARREGVARRA